MLTLAEAVEVLAQRQPSRIITATRLRALCAQRRIPGARLLGGRLWLLPENFQITPGKRGPRAEMHNVEFSGGAAFAPSAGTQG